MSASPYEILGVDKSASDQDIKRAYRALTLKYHPDRNPTEEAAAKIREINDAYGVLSDPQKRRQLDRPMPPSFPSFRHGGMGGVEVELDNPADIFQMLFGGGLPGGMMFHHVGGGQPQDFFDPRFQPKPPPIQQHLTLTLEQAYTGCTVPIEVDRWVMQGHLKVQEIETVYVDIPPGIDDCEILTLVDKGNALNDNCRGVVKVNIRIENTTVFRRQGLDLIYSKTLTLKESLCGFGFELKHINGKTLAMNNVQNVVKPNYRKVVPGMGLKRDKSVGALIIEFDVQFPDTLTLEQMAALREIL